MSGLTSDPGDENAPPRRGPAVLVTGAGGFVGGHVAATLALAGYRVRALTRRVPVEDKGPEGVEWFRGDLCRPDDLSAAVRGMNLVVHAGGWVSLGPDAWGESRRVNVEATSRLLGLAEEAGVERFLYTSTLWTTAAGTVEAPADESTGWNLSSVRCPYSETKREAEALVLARNSASFSTSVVCPAMVVGPGDRRPGSTGLLLAMARSWVAFLPGGGIPLVDVRVLASAHRKALERGTPGSRYVVAGDYLSYHEMARLVGAMTGRPRLVVNIPDAFRPGLGAAAEFLARAGGGRLGNVSGAATGGGFLRLHVSGARADRELGLTHMPAARSIFETLDDHRRSGRVPWLVSVRWPDESGRSTRGGFPLPALPVAGGDTR